VQNLDRFAQLFSQEFSGLRAKRAVGQLTQLHRIQASPGLSAAVDLMRQAAEAGWTGRRPGPSLSGGRQELLVNLEEAPVLVPQRAELRLIAPEEEVLARFEDEPCRLGAGCAPSWRIR